MPDTYIASAVRTPIGKFLGSLSNLRAPELGSKVVRESIVRSGLRPEDVGEVVLGCVLQAGLGQNPARQAALGAGVPASVGALTVNKVCGSGLRAVISIVQAIRSGDLTCGVAGGMESMSNAPYLMPDARRGSRLGNAPLVDALVHDGLWDAANNFHMGITGELVAEKYAVSRRTMDEYAQASHAKAVAAQKSGKFRREILPVNVEGPKGDTLIDADEGIRADATVEKLSTLKPTFKSDGVVTPGNASQISDGAAALVIVSEELLRARKLTPLAKITGYATSGLDPKWVMMTPLAALENLERKCGIRTREVDLIELNEAFAVQACAILKEAKLDPARINVHGGAVALGHPIGASGARILVTLIHALQDRKLRTGIATLCMGGGNGLALAIELC